MAAVAWRLNGVDLDDDSRGWKLQRASTWRAPVSARRSVISFPGRPGELVAGAAGDVEAPIITFEWLVVRRTASELDATLDDLVLLLTSRNASMSRTTQDGSARETSATVSFLSMSERDGLTISDGAAYCRIVAQLKVPGACWRGQSQDWPLPAGRTVLSTGSTAPIVDSVLRISGPMSSVQVVDDVSWSSITWTGSLASGQYAFIDTARLTLAKTSDANAWTLAGTDSPEVDYSASGSLRITPMASVGAPRYASVTATIVGSGYLTLRTRAAYL